ncbi:MAG: hypothetical protein ACR2H3_07665 [Acidimicrobiales bacterium]
MDKRSLGPHHRRAVFGIVLMAVCILLAGCTTASYQCSNSTCEVTLSGEGATTDLGVEGRPITLVSVTVGVAVLDFGGDRGSCSVGDTVELSGASVECTEVGDNAVQLTITG